MEIGLGAGQIVLDVDPAPLPQKGGTDIPQFLAHVCCCETAGWIKMPLDMELGLGPGFIVLDGDARDTAPNFWPMSIVAKRLDGSRWVLAWR